MRRRRASCYQLKRSPTEPYTRESVTDPSNVFTVVGSSPPNTRPISTTNLRIGMLNETSANMLPRVIDCEIETSLDVTPLVVAFATALALYLSQPMPAARPNATRLLLATIRQASVFSSKLFTRKVAPPALPLTATDGKSRLRYVIETPGVMSDS